MSNEFENECENEFENEVPEVFKCRCCDEISYKELMCHCNDDEAKEYMDNHTNSVLASTIVKCSNCSNSWFGYKKCDCSILPVDTPETETEIETEI